MEKSARRHIPNNVDCEGAAFVSLADDLEQQVGAGLVDGEIAEFVEDQQPGSDIASEVAFELTGGLGGGEGVDGVDGAGEQHGVAPLARLQAEGCDQMGLAEPDAADEHDVGGVVEEAQAEEVLDLEAVDLLRPGPVEGIEGFLHGESGETDAPFNGTVASQVGLALDESFEHGEVVGLLFGGAAHDVGVVLADEGELEGVEMGVEGIEVGAGLTACHREVLRAGRRVRGRAGGARVRAGRRAG